MSQKTEIISTSQAQTRSIGKSLAGYLHKGDILCLFGELGSGKTQLVKGIALGLGAPANQVNSPSFVLLKQYAYGITLNHFDLFRLKKIEEILAIGFEEYVYSDNVSVIEWAEKLFSYKLNEFLGIEFKIISKDMRRLTFFAQGKRGRALLGRINSTQDFVKAK
jgi:tRNA threonylcarbamoyladenosine biosynthesis protein TsaE